MKFKDLGNDGLRVSAIGLGCMGMSHAYGAAPDRREMSGLLADAVDMGYPFFDTAESYGTATCPHDGEELLGEAPDPSATRLSLPPNSAFRSSFPKPPARTPSLRTRVPRRYAVRSKAPCAVYKPTISTSTTSTAQTPTWSRKRWQP